MKIGFDLDGTLDRVEIQNLAHALLLGGHRVYVLTGCFLEAGEWQNYEAKYEKLGRMGFAWEDQDGWKLQDNMFIEIFDAVDHKKFDRDYRLADIGLRKGDFIAREGIEIMFDDSELYVAMMPKMCGAQIVRVMP